MNTKDLGLRYYPQSCQYEKPIKRMVSQLGEVSYRIYDMLLKQIYREKGYYIPLSQNTLKDFMTDHGFESSSKLGKTIRFLIEEKIFDRTLYCKFKILTSTEIQENFFRANRRKRNLADAVSKQYLTDFIICKFGKRLEMDGIIEDIDDEIQPKLNESNVSLKKKEITIKETRAHEENGSYPHSDVENTPAQEQPDELQMKRELEEDVLLKELYDRLNKCSPEYPNGILAAASDYWKPIQTKMLKCLVFLIRLNKTVTVDGQKMSGDDIVTLVYWLDSWNFIYLVQQAGNHEEMEDVNKFEFYMLTIICRRYWKEKEAEEKAKSRRARKEESKKEKFARLEKQLEEQLEKQRAAYFERKDTDKNVFDEGYKGFGDEEWCSIRAETERKKEELERERNKMPRLWPN